MSTLCFRRLFAVIFAFLAAGCAVDLTPKDPATLGKLFSSNISGTWVSTHKNGGVSIQMVKTYLPDGKAYGVLLAKNTRGGVSVVMPEVRFRSRWRVSGGIVETYDIEASVKGMFKRGEVIRDQILSVQPDRIILRAQRDGTIQISDRLKSSR